MSNVLTKNPLVIDTVSTSLLTKSITPVLAYWVGATATHDLTLTDLAGNTILKVKAVTATDTFTFPPGFTVGGLACSVIGSGTVYLYVLEDGPYS
jgi:hypothetical protein